MDSCGNTFPIQWPYSLCYLRPQASGCSPSEAVSVVEAGNRQKDGEPGRYGGLTH